MGKVKKADDVSLGACRASYGSLSNNSRNIALVFEHPLSHSRKVVFHSRPIDYRARLPKIANPVPKYSSSILSADHTDARRFSGQGIGWRLYKRLCCKTLTMHKSGFSARLTTFLPISRSVRVAFCLSCLRPPYRAGKNKNRKWPFEKTVCPSAKQG
jgi:hypothetical protein